MELFATHGALQLVTAALETRLPPGGLCRIISPSAEKTTILPAAPCSNALTR